jgi:hypothetical protein
VIATIHLMGLAVIGGPSSVVDSASAGLGMGASRWRSCARRGAVAASRPAGDGVHRNPAVHVFATKYYTHVLLGEDGRVWSRDRLFTVSCVGGWPGEYGCVSGAVQVVALVCCSCGRLSRFAGAISVSITQRRFMVRCAAFRLWLWPVSWCWAACFGFVFAAGGPPGRGGAGRAGRGVRQPGAADARLVVSAVHVISPRRWKTGVVQAADAPVHVSDPFRAYGGWEAGETAGGDGERPTSCCSAAVRQREPAPIQAADWRCGCRSCARRVRVYKAGLARKRVVLEARTSWRGCLHCPQVRNVGGRIVASMFSNHGGTESTEM